MNIQEFRERIKPGMTVIVGGKQAAIKEVVKFRLDDGDFYTKCFLEDNQVLADDLNGNIFIFAKETKDYFDPSFPEKLDYDGREFKFLYTAHAIAEETYGEEIFKKGDSESFWDYKADDGRYLSLGITDSTKERADFYGEVIPTDAVNLTE
jgi:hypothetical protein